jgi:hypothetical protein
MYVCSCFALSINPQVRRIQQLKRVAIAEGFQLTASKFELLDKIIRTVRKDDRFFGNIQVVFEGDPLQYVFSSKLSLSASADEDAQVRRTCKSVQLSKSVPSF